jgi:hypothetical protein
MVIALTFLVIGIVWLLEGLGIIEAQLAGIIWPALLIGLSLSMILKGKKCCGEFKQFGKTIKAEFKDEK